MLLFLGNKIVAANWLTISRCNSYSDLLPNRYLCSEYSRTMAGFGMPQLCNTDGYPELASYSTDMGT